MTKTVPRTAAEPRTEGVHEILESPEFKALVRKRWTVSAVLLAALFVTYYGFILLIASDKAFMSQRIGEFTTLAIPVGIGVIVLSFVLTALYVVWANKSYDPEVERLRKRIRS